MTRHLKFPRAAEPKVSAAPTLEGRVREAMASDGTAEEQARIAGLSPDAFTQAWYVLRLAKMAETLPSAEQEAVAAALAEMNAHENVTHAYGLVAPVVERHYPERRRQEAERVLRIRLQQFNRGYRGLIRACSHAQRIEVPAFPAEEAAEIADKLGDAADRVLALRRRVKAFAK